MWCLDETNDCSEGTQWSKAFNFNVMCMFVSGINFLVLMLGSFFFYPRLLGTVCNCCAACCSCIAFSSIFTVRFSPLGQLCAVNIAPSTFTESKNWSKDTTYKSDGDLL